MSSLHTSQQYINGVRAKIIFSLVSIQLVFQSILKYRSLKDAYHVLRKLSKLRMLINDGRSVSRYVKAQGKYYYSMYVPGFPSRQLNRMYDFEMERIKPTGKRTPYLRFAFLAVTRKCPLKCEHCFEAENLNKKEVLAYDDLRNAILRLKDAGVVQIFLSGGEPMLRVKEILKLAEEFHHELDLWVVTSGFNASNENLLLLRQAGIRGLFVSLDHYDKSLHNIFRGSNSAYEDALAAIRNARSLGMPVAMSVCVTRSFANENDLMKYAGLAKSLDTSFIQLLEPKVVGNYAGKDVLLNDEHKKVIEKFTQQINNDKNFRDYPLALYHGYHQRQVGCFAAGNRSLYIDSCGDILSCPFCHHKSGNILKDNLIDAIETARGIGCTDYKSAEI
ncbi:MAG: radical SAM protein [Bacteroidia bacterium]|nr:radical SAM protein [Bacteroidia bacterium]